MKSDSKPMPLIPKGYTAVPGYTNRWVNTLGVVWGAKGRDIRPKISQHGYLYVQSRRDGERTSKNTFVHRLVAMTFIPNPEGKPHVNHLDGNKFNNQVSNLAWCTPAENNKHARGAGLFMPGRLSKSQRALLRRDADTGVPAVELAKAYGVSVANVKSTVGITSPCKHPIKLGWTEPEDV